MTQDQAIQQLYQKSLDTMTQAAVALFHQVLIREARMEVLNAAIAGTEDLINKVTNEFLAKEELGPYFRSLENSERQKILGQVQGKVLSNLKDYVYHSHATEISTQ